MQRWKSLIVSGNRSLELGRVLQARAAYAEALFEAERLLNDRADNPEAIAAYVTTRHNLADLFDSIDEPERALGHYEAAHSRMRRLVADAGARPGRLLAALRHCRHSREAWRRYALLHGFDTSAEPRPMVRRSASLHPMPRSAAN